MKYIFIDTNIFLHFQDFEKIDWLTESSSKICTLIIPPIVIDELDEKKIGTGKISSRARKILNRFEELVEKNKTEIADNVKIKIILTKPKKEIYESNDLNFDEKDHRLMASLIQFKKNNNHNEILLCSYDIGPRLRAKMFDIESLKLDSKYLLPNQISEEEKKIKRLERENQALKFKVPQLEVLFNNEKEFIKFQTRKLNDLNFEEYKVKKINEIKIKNPYLKKFAPSDTQTQFTFLNSSTIREYNEKLDGFYSEYENILNEIYEYDKKELLSFEILLILKNKGNIPAKDIDLHLHFPDGFELIESSNKEKPPTILPKPPYKPKHSFDFFNQAFPILSPSYTHINSSVDLKLNSPTIKKTNSYDVDYSRTNLKHGYSEKLEPLLITFKNTSSIINFQIDYKLSSANIPEILTGKLNVIFKE